MQENFSSKDWQDGLRALLPSNVNVSFGQGGGNTGPGGLGHFGLQNNFQPSYSQQQERQQGLQHNSSELFLTSDPILTSHYGRLGQWTL